MLPAKLCTAWIALLCLERIKNYVLERVKVFDAQVSEWATVLIVSYQSIKNTLLHVLYIRFHENNVRAKTSSVDHDFLLLKSVLMFS